MKCDELKVCKGDVTIPVYGTIADAQVYLKKDVDAAIDELKTEHHKERDEYISMVHSREQTIKELKQKLEDVNELIKTARQMLEDVLAKLEELNRNIKNFPKNNNRQPYFVRDNVEEKWI